MTRASDVDMDFVMRQRARRASWSAIARMAGCSEADLRRQFDPTATAMAMMRPVPPRTPREQVEAWMTAHGLDRDQARILARLWQANGKTLTSAELAQGIGGGGLARTLCLEARAAGRKRLGLAFAAHGFAMTAEDVVSVRDRAGLGRTDPGKARAA